MPIVYRLLFGLVVVVVVLALLMVLERSEAEGQTIAPSKWDDHIDELERQAIDEAFKKYIGQLYNIWVTDRYEPKIPPKALIGARHARDAYVRSMEAIEKRREK
jgi:hypothetical protein